MEFALLQAVFLPLLLSPVAYLVGRRFGPGVTTWFAFGILLYCTSLLILPVALSGSYEEHYPWTSLFGEFGFVLDGLAAPFAIIIYVLSTILALYSKPYMVEKIKEQYEEKFHGRNHGQKTSDGGKDQGVSQKVTTSGDGSGGSTASTAVLEESEYSSFKKYLNNEIGIYFGLYLAFAMGMLGTVLATNLIQFYIFFEVMLIPSFLLVAFYGYGARRRIALLFLFWTHVGAVVLLLGFLAIGLHVGSFDFAAIDQSVIPPDILAFAAAAMIIGLGVKLAAFVFHIWLPYAHAEAPTPISALLSPAMIGIGAYGLFRLVITLLPGAYEDYAIWLHLWGLATMLYGGAMALMQDDLKRLLAYSSISQMGYILFGIGSLSTLGLSGAEFMYISHGLGKGILFMMAGAVILQVGTRSMARLGGLAGKMPITAVCAMIGALTIMGVPPTSGFMGEWTLFYGALQTAVDEGSTVRMVAFGLGLVSTVITMSYILWMIKRVFFGKTPEHLASTKEASWYVTAPMMVLAGFTIVLGIYPDIFYDQIVPFMSGLMGGPSPVTGFGGGL